MAEDQNRSLASILEKLLIDHLRAEGYLPPIEGPGMKRKEGDDDRQLRSGPRRAPQNLRLLQ